ncbi:MAG TPA: EamA family transporter [Anaerolineae bacterium]
MGTLTYILPSVFLSVIGQLLLKQGMSGMGSLSLGNNNVVALIWRIFTNPWIIVGVGCYVVGLLFWLIALSRAPLSIVYPFAALTMALVVFSSALVFGEQITFTRLVGVAAIVLGVAVVARS